MNIIIPANLQKLLDQDAIWSAKVTGLQKNVEPFLVNQLEFFPDYTIHGTAHINEVLEHADRLIHPKTYEVLKPRDAAFLISAVILHDLGMFLSAAGIRKLLDEHEEWQARWDTFVDRTKRYTEEKMLYCFGKNITVKEVIPPADQMTRYDRLVVGEFLRQNHPALAQEIALSVMPGADDQDIFRNTGFKSKERDMIGLLARSHGMAIREMESYVQSNFDNTSCPYNTPAYYLMAVLRIADYLDAGEHRAPVALEKLRGIPVPLSLEEWKWNQCIDRDACRWDTKKNNRRIDAEPESSIEYVQLDKWLKSVQAELDLSWSVIAEKYTDEPYRLSIHRITCNIYDPGVREKMDNDFLTKEVKVTANPEIAKLMIDPLYGSNPSYGVRELIQNAVDACIEREHKEKDPDYKGLVTVRIDPWVDPKTGENLGIFTIEDNGIGMDENVLMNYYLSAGASYRSSDEWKRDFTENNQSQIARTGKFGVGFLAAFLLGDCIQVHTQHKNHKKGYQFEFDNRSKPLNVTRAKRKQGTGTTIQIFMKSGVWKLLSDGGKYPWFNWYAFDDPKVRYYFDGKPVYHKGVSLSRHRSQNTNWFTLQSNDFATYLWSIPQNNEDPQLYCNGFRIYGSRYDKVAKQTHDSPFPHVSIIDSDMKLEVDLSRSHIQHFPEEDALWMQCYRYHIARLLTTPWSTDEDFQNNLADGFFLYMPNSGKSVPFLLNSRGFTLNYVYTLATMSIDRYVLMYYNTDSLRHAVKTSYRFLPPDIPISVIPGSSPSANTTNVRKATRSSSRLAASFVETLLSGSNPSLHADTIRYNPREFLTRLWIEKRVSQDINMERFSWLLTLTGSQDNILFFDWEAYNRSPADRMPIIIEHFDPYTIPVVMLFNLSKDKYYFEKYCSSDFLFSSVLQELLVPAPDYPDQDMWIPFDMEERKKKFPNAFKELAYYINKLSNDN